MAVASGCKETRHFMFDLFRQKQAFVSQLQAFRRAPLGLMFQVGERQDLFKAQLLTITSTAQEKH